MKKKVLQEKKKKKEKKSQFVLSKLSRKTCLAAEEILKH